MATEDNIDATLAALKVIGMVQKNGKLCIRKGQLCLDTTNSPVAQAAKRWLNGDSRDAMLMHAKNVMHDVVKINRLIMNESPISNVAMWTLTQMLSELERCEVGLVNLKSTYSTDSIVIAALDVMIERQRAHQDEVRKFLVPMQQQQQL
jgi:hypothetical protein